MEDVTDIKKFETTTELIKYLGIGRPTFYRRAKALGIPTNKGLYTTEELEALRSPLDGNGTTTIPTDRTEVNKVTERLNEAQQQLEQIKQELALKEEQLKQSQEQLTLKDEQLKQVPSPEYIELLKHTTETAEDTVKNANEQLRAKDTQLEALTKALDQSQRLQSDLQVKLDKARLELETVQREYTVNEHPEQGNVTPDTSEQLNRTQEHKGFWARLFNNWPPKGFFILSKGVVLLK